ncbi:MAG: hypothetical protein IJ910_07365 [Bacteroidaceae bacterium]|nr:hypothetical protein [Bacteroidaceae bacterium]
MEQSIQKLLSLLRIEFYVVLASAFIPVALGEFNLLPVGELADDRKAEYVFNVVVILQMIITVPFALKIFSLNTKKSLHRYTFEKALLTYHRWSVLRLCLLLASTIVGVMSYYLTFSTTGLLCAAITFLTIIYCYPSSHHLRQYIDDCRNDLS